jgi:transposase-like protein
MAKRSSTGVIVCPRCGVPNARVIGRSDSYPVIYLRCDDCGRTTVLPEHS